MIPLIVFSRIMDQAGHVITIQVKLKNNVTRFSLSLSLSLSLSIFCIHSPLKCFTFFLIGIAAMVVDLTRVQAGLLSVGCNLECEPIQTIWFDLVNTGIFKLHKVFLINYDFNIWSFILFWFLWRNKNFCIFSF